MSRPKKESNEGLTRTFAPAITPEERDNQLIALTMDLVERQLRDGTASNHVISHYLKLSTQKYKTEQEILERQKELLEAKTESLKSSKRIEELYENAINAMKDYSGQTNDEDIFAP